MQVLRDNKESLMAVLEAFVYDPLISWRLMQTEVEVRRPEGMTPTQMFPLVLCSPPFQTTLVTQYAPLNWQG
jgi:phosphatidylinositol kinase/protein kinase (PI-3  family)